MKKFLVAVAIFATGISALAQVGVDTNTPTEELDVNGRVRIQNLPKEGEAITTAEDGTVGTNTFTPTGNMVVDKNGVVGVSDANTTVKIQCSRAPEGEYNMKNAASLVFDMGDFSVKWNNYGGVVSTTNNFQLKNNTQTVDNAYFGVVFGDVDAYSANSGTVYNPGEWKDAFRHINWDTEEQGGLFIHFNNSADYYKVTSWSRKQSPTSEPRVCMSVQRFGGATILTE